MDGYLLDTYILSILLDPAHPKQLLVSNAIASLDPTAPKYLSVVALGELIYGERLIFVFTSKSPRNLAAKIQQAQTYPLLNVTKHTAAEYGELKSILANAYFTNLQNRRPRWLENWIDQVSGQMLQVDENDLWMCAQARERNLVFVSTDAKMLRVSSADPSIQLHII